MSTTTPALPTTLLALSWCPGLGQSKAAEAPVAVGQLAPGGFLKQVFEALDLEPSVLISPSLSGSYSLPFLFQNQALVRGYVPVAPICTDKFTADQYGGIQVGTEAARPLDSSRSPLHARPHPIRLGCL